MRVLGKDIDERFLTHRLRSSSAAGIAGGVCALLLFAYRYYVQHRWSWDALAVAMVIVVVKLTLMVWYRITD